MKTNVRISEGEYYLEFVPEDELEVFELGQISVRLNKNIINYKHDAAQDKMVMSYVLFPISEIRKKLNSE